MRGFQEHNWGPVDTYPGIFWKRKFFFFVFSFRPHVFSGPQRGIFEKVDLWFSYGRTETKVFGGFRFRQRIEKVYAYRAKLRFSWNFVYIDPVAFHPKDGLNE